MGNHLISAGQAAKLAGVAPSTISKKLKAGVLSYVEKTPKGGYLIDPAEVVRVFPVKPITEAPIEDQETVEGNIRKDPRTLALIEENAALRAKLEAIEATGERERTQLVEQVEDLRERLDRSEKRCDGLTERLLPAPQRPVETPRGFWGMFTRRNA